VDDHPWAAFPINEPRRAPSSLRAVARMSPLPTATATPAPQRGLIRGGARSTPDARTPETGRRGTSRTRSDPRTHRLESFVL